ncbi:MAG: PorT family protein [Chitinophagia bacterium]|nr:PorT family protein [Chitinophagia bacterium]
MRKITILRALFVFCLWAFLPSIHICAQESTQNADESTENRLFRAGIVAGCGLSQVDGDNFAGYHRFGINAGGILYMKLPKHTALSIELLYTQKGAKSDRIRGTGVDTLIKITDYAIKLQYAEIPILFNVFDQRESHASIGISYAALFSSTETISTVPANQVDFGQYPFRKSDINFIIGGSLKLVKHVYLNARFQYSLTPIRTQIPQYYARSSQYNNQWIIRIAYIL